MVKSREVALRELLRTKNFYCSPPEKSRNKSLAFRFTRCRVIAGGAVFRRETKSLLILQSPPSPSPPPSDRRRRRSEAKQTGLRETLRESPFWGPGNKKDLPAHVTLLHATPVPKAERTEIFCSWTIGGESKRCGGVIAPYSRPPHIVKIESVGDSTTLALGRKRDS